MQVESEDVLAVPDLKYQWKVAIVHLLARQEVTKLTLRGC
jgi:hypothetical protein